MGIQLTRRAHRFCPSQELGLASKMKLLSLDRWSESGLSGGCVGAYLLMRGLCVLWTTENKLVVVIPASLLRIDARLDWLGGRYAGGARAARAHTPEAGLLKTVECLLQAEVFEKESRRVAIVVVAVVRVTGLVQSVAEDFAADRHPAGYQ